MAKTSSIQTLKAGLARAEQREDWATSHAADLTRERDLLVRALSKIYPSHLMRHRGKSGHHKPVVCIIAPSGQLCWTLRDGDKQALESFRHLEWKENDWDGHTATDRLARLEAL